MTVWCATDVVPAAAFTLEPASVVNDETAVLSAPPVVVLASQRYQVVAAGATAFVTT